MEGGYIISVEVDGITESYFNFLTQIQQEYAGSNPLFGGPPANPTSNVQPSKMAVGYFNTYSIARKFIRY
jgi:hypothetical protein